MQVEFGEPSADCPFCPRLVAFRNDQRRKFPTWHNAPVPTFGTDARALIIGLAPGLQGANRTGRPFTGDWAGDLLYATLSRFSMSSGIYDERPDDGVQLVDVAITNAVRCVPPLNKPTGPEIATCRAFLVATIQRQLRLTAVLALGRIAHESAIRALGTRLSSAPFSHGREHHLNDAAGRPIVVFDSYHCSRYNTNTGVLTTAMFEDVFRRLRRHLDERLAAA